MTKEAIMPLAERRFFFDAPIVNSSIGVVWFFRSERAPARVAGPSPSARSRGQMRVVAEPLAFSEMEAKPF
jgi:hypothetical protein